MEASNDIVSEADAPNPNPQNMRHNIDIFNISGFVLLWLFAFVVLAILIIAASIEIYRDQQDYKHNVVFYIFLDLLHPTLAMVVYPSITLLRNRAEVCRYAKQLFLN